MYLPKEKAQLSTFVEIYTELLQSGAEGSVRGKEGPSFLLYLYTHTYIYHVISARLEVFSNDTSASVELFY